MSDETAATLSTRGRSGADDSLGQADRAILRDLARNVAELAARPCEQQKRELWYAHNDLEPTRPVIFCDPENGWNEIFTPDRLECEGDMARGWEMMLRKEIFWGRDMGDDRVTTGTFTVSHVCTESDWGMRDRKIGGQGGGSYVWEAPIRTYDQLDQLRFPRIEVDRQATDRVVSLASDVFDGILPVRLRTGWWWTLGMTWTCVILRGLEQVMVDMIDDPENLKRLMAFLRDGHLAKLDFLEENGLLFLNNDDTYVGSGGFGWTRELPRDDFVGNVRPIDMWGFAESQETGCVSPGMFEEFVFQFQLPILERFGLNCYGCCEAIDKRWRVVEKVPRLRRVSVSAWADPADMAEKLGDRYILSLKPSPTDLAMQSFDEDRIRADLRRTFRATRNCRVEAIMKDNHTIGRDASRVTRWSRIAREEAEAVA